MKDRLRQIARERGQRTVDLDHEAALGHALAPLRELHPAPDLRTRNRRRLEAALAAEERRRLAPRLPLWRRRVSLTLPWLALLLAAAAALGAALFWLADLYFTPIHPTANAATFLLAHPKMLRSSARRTTH